MSGRKTPQSVGVVTLLFAATCEYDIDGPHSDPEKADIVGTRLDTGYPFGN